MLAEKQIYKPSPTYLLLDRESGFRRKISFSSLDSTKIIVGSQSQEATINEWDHIIKAVWEQSTVKPEFRLKKHKRLIINENITLEIPIGLDKVNQVFVDAKYILNLEDDWDENGGLVYEEEVWKKAAEFLITYFKWIKTIYDGNLYMPKMYHGPNGTIDFVWDELNYRLFINLDCIENKGNFFSDSPNNQYSEGEFGIDDVKFNLLPLPIKY